MKKIKILITISILAISFVACEQDDELQLNSDKFRIKSLTEVYTSGKEYKYSFYYTEDRLDSICHNKSKIEYNYSETNVSITRGYYTENGIWEITRKFEFVIENGLVVEEIYYDNNDDFQTKSQTWVYQYSELDLTNWLSTGYNVQGLITGKAKGEYTYKDNKLVEYCYYVLNDNTWNQGTKETFEYSGKKLIQRTGELLYDFGWRYYFKNKYSYSNGLVTKIKTYSWNINTDWEEALLFTFWYNNNACLIVKDDNVFEKIIYEYEEVKGNAKSLWYHPEELIRKEPTFKKSSSKQEYNPIHERMINKLINRQ
jgi:hypothetical protein